MKGGVFKRSLTSNFVPQQEHGGIWQHPFSLSLAPHESVLTSSGLKAKESSIFLASQGCHLLV